MEKTFAVLKKELTDTVINGINANKLDICIAAMIIKEISDDLTTMAARESSIQNALYIQSLKNKEDHNNEKPSDD